MSKKWTISNAVKRFKPNQKRSLERNNGNLNVDELNSLIKEMKCYYEFVEVGEGKGRNRMIVTDKKRKVKAKKEDKRQFNKGQAPEHSMYLALMVMSKMDGIDNKARTSNGWATFFGLISPAEQDIMSGIYSEEALKPYKEYMIRIGILEDGEENVFQDLAYTLRNICKGQLQTVLRAAATEGMELITIISSWKGKVKKSKEAIDIDNSIAMEIKKREDELLKKHGITKQYSIMFKNSAMTKAFKGEWLKYIENVEDADGNAMHLQYIYEVFQIKVLNRNAFDEYMNAHYPSENKSFNLLQNEQVYHSKLHDYVLKNAQKKQDNHMKKKQDKVNQVNEGMKELMMALGMSEEEAVKSFKQQREEEASKIGNEQSSYMALLESDGYIDCIRKLHVKLHHMSAFESQEIKDLHLMMIEQTREELAQLGLSKTEKVKNTKGILNHEPCTNTNEQREDLLKIERIKQLGNQEPQGIAITKNTINDTSKIYNAKDYEKHDEAMAELKKVIKEMEYDAVIKELTREEVTMFGMLYELQQLQSEKDRERKEWDELFVGGQPVKWERTTNNPLEVFHRIRYGNI
ncbi:MAG: hypothetical protein WBB47_13090 [Paenisporosarcina sp.]